MFAPYVSFVLGPVVASLLVRM